MNVVIMAAGMGKRMRSELPKVLHRVAGEPILFHILDRVRTSHPESNVAIVVGHGREIVQATIRSESRFTKMKIEFVHQAHQRGTGDAIRCAVESKWGEAHIKGSTPVLVLPGDCPLFTDQLIQQLMEPLAKSVPLRLLTCELKDPTGYGRVVKRGKKTLRIVEEKDANAREKEIREVAVSIYVFQGGFLRAGVTRLNNKNAQGEFYLTDLVAQASQQKKHIDVMPWDFCDDLRGINNPWELAEASRILNQRLIKKAAMDGVRFQDPGTTHLEVNVEIAPDVDIGPGVVLQGRTRIATGARIDAYSVIRNSSIGENSHIRPGSVIEDSKIGRECSIGPYAHFRPDSEVGDRGKIGNFVELKATKICEDTHIAHLSYLGDATVGKRVNIGCGFITCNFDGRVIDGKRKHPTVIEDDVFVGSDCQAIAPITIGARAYVASGSTLTDDVEADALAIARARQVEKKNYAKKFRGSLRS